jgi:hypothetical protein
MAANPRLRNRQQPFALLHERFSGKEEKRLAYDYVIYEVSHRFDTPCHQSAGEFITPCVGGRPSTAADSPLVASRNETPFLLTLADR